MLMKDRSWSLNLQNFSPLRVPSLLSKPHPVSCVSWGWFGQEGRSVVSKMRQDDGQEYSFSVSLPSSWDCELRPGAGGVRQGGWMEFIVLMDLWLPCNDKNPVATLGSLEERNLNKVGRLFLPPPRDPGTSLYFLPLAIPDFQPNGTRV